MEPLSNMGRMHIHCAAERHKEWQSNNKNLVLNPGDIVKMGFDSPTQKRAEHMWVEITWASKDQKHFKGTLENCPIRATQYKLGDFLEFTRDEIEQHVITK